MCVCVWLCARRCACVRVCAGEREGGRRGRQGEPLAEQDVFKEEISLNALVQSKAAEIDAMK